MRKLYFVRHGETDWNQARKLQGHVDIPLNENGRSQAARAAEVLAPIPFHACISSPLNRAQETASLLLQNRPLPTPTDPDLVEIGFGSGEGYSIHDSKTIPDQPLYNFYHDPDNYIPPTGGESYPELFARCHRFLSRMEPGSATERGLLAQSTWTGEGDENILVASHGAFIRGMVMTVEQLPLGLFLKGRRQLNCSYTVFGWVDGRWKLLEEAVDTQS